MLNYKKTNNLLGWITFLIATAVYMVCIEPTASFWDCGEFIATAYKLEVGHPPGAPFFQLMVRFFTLFAGDDVTKVPVMANYFSALMSGLTILFLFWSITAIAKKAVVKAGEALTKAQLIAIMGAGLAGALAYTFSDSFWFSAVEGEVYGTSSFFTAIVFWAILKWENVANEKHSARWIILIAYLMGLSIGVHLLNLLTIPALAFVYYFKRYPTTTWGLVKTFIVSCIILGAVQFGIIQRFVSIGAKFDLFFVNTLGLTFGSGFLFYIVAVLAGVIWGIRYTIQHNKPIWNTVILCFAFIIIGYSSFVTILVRSNANPPMDENNPENVYNFLSYLNREQYGDFPLSYGQYYSAKVVDQEQGEMTYTKGKDRYIETGHKTTAIYDPKQCTIFPRMWSNQPSHIQAYKKWEGIEGDRKPTFAENLGFFFKYQVGYMYGRYFMWNFVGRQNDIQGDSNIKDGNWISGIKAIDALRLGNQDKLPESMTNNKGMNKFYFLPLILGLLGLYYHYKKDSKDAFVVFLLFFFTGMAIVLYLNQTPYQPRERDYAYAGSFYAFAIWIGLGVLAIIEFLQKKLSANNAAIAGTAIGLLMAPTLMAKEGWDDHNRAHRFTARDFAHDYLNSCAPNAILFTNGDNDTFPLWYAQEVEGIRTDVRVVNLSLLNTDWYIDQMKRKAYNSDPIPSSLAPEKYMQGTRDYVPYYDNGMGNTPMDLKKVIDFIGSDDPDKKVQSGNGESMSFYPTKKFIIPVDTALVVNNGTVPKALSRFVEKNILWDLDKGYLLKADLAILDLLANNNWKRPVYFAITVGNESYLNLESYFQLEGLAYRVVPIKNPSSPDRQLGRVNTDVMYDNLMNKFKWGGMNDPRVYLDENNLRMTYNFRNNFGRLAEALMMEGKRDAAFKVLDKCIEVMPDKTVPYNVTMLSIVDSYYRLGLSNMNDSLHTHSKDLELNKYNTAVKSANAIMTRLGSIYANDLEYYLSLKGRDFRSVNRDAEQGMAIMQELVRMAKEYKQDQLAKELEEKYNKLMQNYTAVATPR